MINACILTACQPYASSFIKFLRVGRGLHDVIDLEVVLVIKFYDVDAVPASLLSNVASAISRLNTILIFDNNVSMISSSMKKQRKRNRATCF